MIKTPATSRALKERSQRNSRTAERLRGLRVMKGLKASWVASSMKITAGYLTYLETGRRPWNDRLEEKFLKAIADK